MVESIEGCADADPLAVASDPVVGPGALIVEAFSFLLSHPPLVYIIKLAPDEIDAKEITLPNRNSSRLDGAAGPGFEGDALSPECSLRKHRAGAISNRRDKRGSRQISGALAKRKRRIADG